VGLSSIIRNDVAGADLTLFVTTDDAS